MVWNFIFYHDVRFYIITRYNRIQKLLVIVIAFEKYKVVDRGHASEYTDSDEPLSAIIYSGDKYNYPTYNTLTNTYEFGGILPDDYNLSTKRVMLEDEKDSKK